MTFPISATILTKNSARHLTPVLDALACVADIVIYDTGSIDDTLAIAEKYSQVRIYQGPFEGFGPTHNKASALAFFDWILAIDSDEVATPQLFEQIYRLPIDAKAVYSIKRHNFLNGKHVRWGSWRRDNPLRFYNRSHTSFNDAQVHETIITTGLPVIALQGPLLHYPYATMADFIAKQQSYSELFVRQNGGKVFSSPWKATSHGLWSFFKSYMVSMGFLDGYEGLMIALHNGNTAFYKYWKLYEYNQRVTADSKFS